MTNSHAVLVVDDDPAIRQMFAAVLKHHGFETELVADGDTALKCIRAVRYDAILLDLMLPRLNGFEVIQHLKCVSPDILRSVIVVTAASELTLRFFDAKDVRRLLRKPLDIDELVREVATCAAEQCPESAPTQVADC